MTTLHPARSTGIDLGGSPFAVDVSASGDDLTVRVVGELNEGTATELEPVLTAAALFHPARLNVDLEEMSFIDETGVRLFKTIGRLLRSRQAELVLRSPNAAVRELFDLLDVGRYATTEL